MICGTFLAVQWLRLNTFNAGGMGLILNWGIKIPHAVALKKKKKKENDLWFPSARKIQPSGEVILNCSRDCKVDCELCPMAEMIK